MTSASNASFRPFCRSWRPGIAKLQALASVALAPVTLALSMLIGAPSASGASEASTREPKSHVVTVRILVARADDPRVEWARSSIAFWNQTFRELGLEPRLGDAEVVVDSPETRSVENYARRIATLAGRMLPGSVEPRPPDNVAALEGDLLLLLSKQRLLPFAWPLEPASNGAPNREGRGEHPRRFLIAVPMVAERAPSITRVIAHEIGHTLGLRHGDDPGALMCQPCERPAAGGEAPALLSPSDRLRILELYSPVLESGKTLTP